MTCPRCGAATSDDGARCASCGHDRNVGRRVGGRYVVEEPLGAGGMGSIHRGRDERLGHAVAIKLLKRSHLHDSVLRARFQREALSLAKLRHPGIVAVLDFGETDGELYTVLELVEGRTLEELREGGAVDAGRAAPIFDQILAALEACHDGGVIHRDMKPSNVMVSDDGAPRVKIIDFGLAHVETGEASKLTETGTVQGTPCYMAPEQCRGEEVTAAADVYSTGIVFYEVLAGAGPFQGKDAATFMAQHLFVEPQPLRRVAPDVPTGVAAAIHRALAKRPDDRPTARELRAALAAAFDGADPETLAEAAAVERRRVAGLDRSARAIGGVEGAHAPRERDRRDVVVWMRSDEASARVLGSLGAAGLSCVLWSSEEGPDLAAAGAVVLSIEELARVVALRRVDPKLPIVVVGVRGPEDTTATIRAGASDMLLCGAPDAELAPKIERLLSRRVGRR